MKPIFPKSIITILTYLGLATDISVLFKLLGIFKWSWMWALIPLYIAVSFGILVGFIYSIIVVIQLYKEVLDERKGNFHLTKLDDK